MVYIKGVDICIPFSGKANVTIGISHQHAPPMLVATGGPP
jgi:hypothetical protein